MKWAQVTSWSDRTKRLLLLLLAFVGFSISLISSAGIRISWIPLDKQLGLLQILPWYFWIGFVLCTISLIAGIRMDSRGIFLLKTILLFLLIWGLPVFFERNPSVWDSYIHFSFAADISRTGFLPKYDVNLYSANWPGAFIFIAAIKDISGLDPQVILRFFPLFTASLTVVAVHLFLKKYLPPITGRMALLIVIFLNVWFQFHASPQSLGLILGLLTLASIERESIPWRVVAILLFLGLLISHATTMFIVVTGLACAHSFQRIRIHRAKGGLESKILSRPALLFSVLALSWLFWNALGTSGTLVRALESQVAQIFFLDERLGVIIGVRTTENIYPLPPYVRIVAIGIFIILSILFLIAFTARRISHRLGKPSNDETPSLAVPISLFVVSFALAAGDILTFGGQFYDRNILFIAVISPSFALLLINSQGSPFESKKSAQHRWAFPLNRRYGAIVAGILIVSLANFATVFYQENFYIVSDASFSGRDYIDTRITEDTIIDGGMFPSNLEGTGRVEPREPFNKRLIVIDIHTEIWRRQWLGIDSYQALRDESRIMSKTYVNGEYQMFWKIVE